MPFDQAVEKVLLSVKLEMVFPLMLPFTKQTGFVPRRTTHIPFRSHSPVVAAPTEQSMMVLLLRVRL